MLQEAERLLKEEEAQDNGFRNSLGPKWSPMPSNSMNGPYKQNIEMYWVKIKQAKQ